MTEPVASKYTEQLERMHRWHERLRPIAEGSEEVKSIEHYRDDMFAFYMNCYHLKDWIKNDFTVPHLKERVEPYINQSIPLSLCANICNGIKHLVLNNLRSGLNPQFSSKPFRRIELGSDSPQMGVGFIITSEGQNYDAFNLAGSCIEEWEFFLIQNDISFLR